MHAQPRLRARWWLFVPLVLVGLVAGGAGRPAPATAQTLGSINTLYAVDCSGPSFCTAVGAAGTILQYHGSGWSSQPSGTANDLYDVACPSASFCVAVGAAGTLLQYNGSSWTGKTSGTGNDLFGVTCQGATLCFAVGGSNGTVLQYNGGGWTGGQRGGITPNALADVACPSASFCFAVGRSGTVLRYSDSSWDFVVPITNNSNLTGVVCPSTGLCFAVGSGGVVLQYNVAQEFANESGWIGQPSSTSQYLSGVACPSTSLCFAVGSGGAVLQYNGSGWSLVQPSVTGNTLSDVACPSTSLCFAVGTNGTILQYNGSSWSSQSSGTAPTMAVTVVYNSGWNLIGGPTGAVIAANSGPLYTYQANDAGYETIPSGTPLQGGVGYWAFFPAQTTETLPVAADAPITVPLAAGRWIMVGNPSDGATALSGADAVYTYSPSVGYTQASRLGPEQGAWVFSQNGGTLSMTPFLP